MSVPKFFPQLKLRRSFWRASAALGFFVAVVIGLTGCLPGVVASPTSGLSYGKGPLDAIRDAADRTTSSGPYSQCGLTSIELAVMMMVPTYFEAGGSVPSPMTLSRYDTVRTWSVNANLFAFGQTSGPYVSAFFSPGIGLWQFDSAGGWDLTAAEAIDVVTASNAAASYIASEWCKASRDPYWNANPQRRRAYAWGAWFGCRPSATSAPCEDRYQQLVLEGAINSAQDAGVDTTGGMSLRNCDVVGLGTNLQCWYVNPANAQGSRWWTGGTYDPADPASPTPLPKPFYVVRANGREYRIWLKADTGYDIGITASHPVRSNARTSIVWERQANLCDKTVYRGECGGAPPIGALDGAWPVGANQVRVAGWAIDLDTTNPIDVHIYAGALGAPGTIGTAITANGNRPDVGAAFAESGSNHGFDVVIPSAVGTQQVCAYGINVGGGNNVQLGCRAVNVTGTPIGSIDAITTSPGSISITGWTAVPGDSTATADIAVDGVVVKRVARSVARDDVARDFPWAGAYSGYATTLSVTGGTHTVCLSAGGSALNVLGCRTVTLPTGSPFGSLDFAVARPGAINVAGWVIDPDLAAPTDVHVWIGAVGTAVRADLHRSDIGTVFPVYGAGHGFNTTIPISSGAKTVCVYGFNQGGGSNTLLGCRQVNVPGGSPFGSLDAVVRGPNGVTVSGWGIDPDTANPIPIHVYVGSVGTAITANASRTDVGAVFPLYGVSHGFSATLSAPQTPVQVCVYAIEAAGTGTNQLLGCRTV